LIGGARRTLEQATKVTSKPNNISNIAPNQPGCKQQFLFSFNLMNNVMLILIRWVY
jgi:hypothetical protein